MFAVAGIFTTVLLPFLCDERFMLHLEQKNCASVDTESTFLTIKSWTTA